MFALPLMLGNVFQQLYTLVDTMVVGRFVGVEALASLGAADWLNWLVLGIPTGFAQGFSILMSQNFGAGEQDELRRSVAMSIVLSAIIAAATLAVSQIFLVPTLKLLNTPENVLPGSILYLRIYFSGIPITMAYNLLSSMLRALGDGRTPLKAMIAAAITNVVLDLLFTVAFGWGIAGVAIATVIAQCVSAVYCFIANAPAERAASQREHFDMRRDIVAHLLRLGAPVALQNTIISIGGLCVQYVVNGFGFIFVAGFTATNKLYGLLEMAAVSFGYAISTYTGQNLGARNFSRIKRGVKSSIKMAILTSAAIGALMLVIGAVYTHAVRVGRAGRGRAGAGYCIYVPCGHVVLPADTVPAVRVPQRAAGHGRYRDTDDIGRGGADNARGRGHAAAADNRPERHIRSRGGRVGGRGGAADAVLL